MLPSPYNFEPEMSDQDFQKIGHLSIKWSHLEHLVGNCLKVMLRLSDQEARIVVFPMGLETRLTRMNELSEVGQLSEASHKYLRELKAVMRGIQYVRNNVIHAIVETKDDADHNFRLHSKNRDLSKQEIFSAEELTNYAAHVVFALRFSLGFRDGSTLSYTLPDRPEIPEFLRSVTQWPKDQEKGAQEP
jgi:hypothetical protein